MTQPIWLLEHETLGESWLAISRLILEEGHDAAYDGAPIKEIARLTTVINAPAVDDPIIISLGDPQWLQWMHENFFEQKEVPELGNAQSYAVRLFNYAHQGRDQVAWVVQTLRDHPAARGAAVTTFMPLTDTTYIPCISLLDFWIPEDSLELIVYAHSLDYGKKAYGNLVELAAIQEHVARSLQRPLGRLVIHVKTAHIYEPEWSHMRQLLKPARTRTVGA